MFEKLFGNKKESKEDRARDIISELSILLNFTTEDQEIFSKGGKLDKLTDRDKGLYKEANALLYSEELELETFQALKDVLTGIKVSYRLFDLNNPEESLEYWHTKLKELLGDLYDEKKVDGCIALQGPGGIEKAVDELETALGILQSEDAKRLVREDWLEEYDVLAGVTH